MLLHRVMFLFADGDDGEGGTDAARGQLLGMISSGGHDSDTESSTFCGNVFAS